MFSKNLNKNGNLFQHSLCKKETKIMNKTEISILAALVIAFRLSFGAQIDFEAERVRQDTLRLHIIAADEGLDSRIVKRQVSGRIASAREEICRGADSPERAKSLIQENLDRIKAAADAALADAGADYTASCRIETYYFPTCTPLPRGEYSALILRLGEGEGKNWWCVLYPQFCPAGEEGRDETGVLWEKGELQAKLKIAELWQEAKRRLSGGAEEYDRL